MNNFAVLDDSQIKYKNGLIIYAHALVHPDWEKTIVFKTQTPIGNIYEQDIMKFLKSNLEDEPLYVCGHYIIYPSIWNYANSWVKDYDVPRNIQKFFSKADQLAKFVAKQELEKLIKIL